MKKFFLKLRGSFLTPAFDGFTANYDGQVHISKVISIKSWSSEDCNIKIEKKDSHKNGMITQHSVINKVH